MGQTGGLGPSLWTLRALLDLLLAPRCPDYARLAHIFEVLESILVPKRSHKCSQYSPKANGYVTAFVFGRARKMPRFQNSACIISRMKFMSSKTRPIVVKTFVAVDIIRTGINASPLCATIALQKFDTCVRWLGLVSVNFTILRLKFH